MGSTSKAQARAMEAAKSGHSTLGIPQEVGAEFAAVDEKRGTKGLPARAPTVRKKAGSPKAEVMRRRQDAAK